MDEKKLKIYICSNVGIDYFFFLATTLEAAGYAVEPIFYVSETDYRRLAKASGMKKIWLRIQMYLLYPLQLMWKGLWCERNSVFIVTSNNFFAPYLMQLFSKLNGSRVIHLLYDLYPDAIEIAGVIKPASFSSKLIGSIMKRTQSSCDATVYLGDYLKEHAEKRWGKAHRSSVIHISTDLTLYSDLFLEEPLSGKIILHYGGQLGHLHDATSLIESIKYVCNSDIADSVEFNFYVSGAQAQYLENSLKDYPVNIISAVPSQQWREDIRNFHIGLVSLSPGGASVCIPSKTYGMMAGGMAILAICPQWSDLSTLVSSLNAGWVINNSTFVLKEEMKNGDYLTNLQDRRETAEIVHNFYNQVKSIIINKDELEQRRKNAFNNVRRRYNIKLLSEKWESILSDPYK